ncbi:MAG TPA: replicative DNA helicase [Candidatus Micrarchaeia archaeon]|nr:replicative DNA helicase [Candidatus Micrarchaeia archaeon]
MTIRPEVRGGALTPADAPSGLRVPPHNLDAERSVLGALLLDKEQIGSAVTVLDPDDFYLGAHGDIYRAMRNCFTRSVPIDTLTLADELEREGTLSRVGGLDTLATLAGSVPTAANLEYYARIVRDHASKRRLIQAGGDVARLGFDERVEAAEAIESAERLVFAVADRGRARGDFQPLSTSLTQTWDELTRVYDSRDVRAVTGVASGFVELDEVTSGFQRSELIVLAARPGVGKTSFALNIARNAAVRRQHAVAIFSLEMSRDNLVQRMLCSEAGVDAYRLRTGQLGDDAWPRIARAMDTLNRARIFIDDTPSLSIMEMRAKGRRIRATEHVDLFVVDYLQLMRASGRQESRAQEVSDISAGLKGLARELDVPVLAISQLNRESERRTDRRPQLSDLRDSGSIEQDSDIVMFLYRPGMHEEGKDPGLTELEISKNRNGPVRRLSLYFNAGQTTFRDLDRHHQAVPEEV